jgi:large conductance mechanosensitive channel
MGWLKEFKAFAFKGNVIDLAVGIIIGVAFGKVVSSLVSDVVMPPIGLAIGGVDFSSLALTLKAASVDSAGKAIPAVTINYGVFINTVIDFLIVAFAVFVLVKLLRVAQRKEEAAQAPPVVTGEERVLVEIRDILKARA